MAIVRAANPKWYFTDLTGNPLDDNYWAFFLTNTVPYSPQDVYQDAAAKTPWNNAMVQFDSSGTLPDNVYFDDTLVYRIEIRRGNLTTDPLIWAIDNYIPNPDTSGTIEAAVITPDNQITNPQFAKVNFSEGTLSSNITAAGTYEIAPGWFITLVGVGTCRLTQLQYTAAAKHPGNPGYALDLELVGWTGQVILFQRFKRVPGLWGSSWISFSMTGISQDNNTHDFNVDWVPSNGVQTPITQNEIETVYQEFGKSVLIKDPTGTQLSDVSYVDLRISIPGTSHLSLTNIQVIGGMSAKASLPYEQDSYERQLDHLYNQDRTAIFEKPATDFLVGWDFGLNPWQFTNRAVPLVITTPYPGGYANYTADQTVIASETQNQIYAIGSGSTNRMLEIVSNGAASVDNFAIIQYIDAQSAAPLLGQRVSLAVQARTQFHTGAPLQLKARILGFTDASVAGFPLSPFAGNPWVLSDPVFNARFTAVSRPEFDVTRTIANSDSNLFTGNAVSNVYTFNNFDLPITNFTGNMYLAVVLFTTTQLQGNTSRLLLQRVSLNVGEIASLPASQTFDQTLQQCRYYYEKSYEVSQSNNHFPTGAHIQNQLVIPMATADIGAGPVIDFNKSPFTIEYKVNKRIAPTFSVWNPDVGNSVNQIRFTIYSANFSTTRTFNNFYSAAGASVDRVAFRASADGYWPDQGTIAGQTAAIRLHYTADARIGQA